MKLVKTLTKPELYLRAGLGLTYLYSGYDIYKSPENWIGYINELPKWMLDAIQSYTSLEKFLLIQGVTEIAMGAILLIWFFPSRFVKWIALLASVKLAVILWFIGIDSVTFRDIGLLGATLAIAAIEHRKG